MEPQLRNFQTDIFGVQMVPQLIFTYNSDPAFDIIIKALSLALDKQYSLGWFYVTLMLF